MSAATERQAARRLLEERWRVAMFDVQRFAGEAGLSSVNSKRYYRIQRTLEELAAILVDGVNDHEYDNAHGGLVSVTEGIWDAIREQLLDWATVIEAQRSERFVEEYPEASRAKVAA
jgi:hypothetical protein